MPDEFGEHLTRDQRSVLHTESLQILQIPRSMLALILFSSAQSSSIGFWFCFWITVLLEDTNMARYKISSTGCQVLIFYLLVFDRIHDAMYLNKLSRTSGRKLGPKVL